MKNLKTICGHLPPAELLAQLAEEAGELGHAALKLRRALIGTNPTPVTAKEAQARLEEEIADVYACVDAVAYALELDPDRAMEICVLKTARWAERLERAE